MQSLFDLPQGLLGSGLDSMEPLGQAILSLEQDWR